LYHPAVVCRAGHAAREAGDVRPDVDLDQAVELLVGPMYHRWMMRTGPLTEQYADGIVDLAMAALRPGAV
jgi:hypothetical protein